MTESALFAFFLGGHDLEMQTIAALVRGEGLPVFDENMTWLASFGESAHTFH